MLFNSLKYAIFFPIVFLIYWVLPHKFRWLLLLVASYYFYMSWNPRYVVLILFTTIVSFLAARMLERQEDKMIKKAILVVSIILCLAGVFFFKYFDFVNESMASLCELFSIKLHPITLNLVLPVGISFYSFQTLSYVIDVYRGEVHAEKNFGYYATFISFFPQLVAGPIERTSNLLPQIKKKREFDYDKTTYGLKLMAWGYFKKLAIADILSVYVDTVYSSIDTCTGLDLVIAILFFTIQIYCDFSGYSDIAIGSAQMMGIDLMTNFRSPYFSTSIKEFWSRWHISLSTWFRDYVYIPLGGNRCTNIKRDRNLMITFLTSGLWHGAGWTYVIWGGLHGLAQIIENHLNIKNNSKVKKIILWILVFAFCNLAWVFFRAESIGDAVMIFYKLIRSIIHPSLLLSTTLGLKISECVYFIISIGILFAFDFVSINTDVITWISDRNVVFRWGCYIGITLFTFIFMRYTGTSEFVYFQF